MPQPTAGEASYSHDTLLLCLTNDCIYKEAYTITHTVSSSYRNN
jgi:hypothetical protein